MPILTQPVRGRKERIPLSEELIQRNLIEAPEKMGDWNFYNIGATTLKALKGAKIIPDKDYEAYEVKKPDALIVKKPIIIAAIEYKTPQELRTEKQIAKAIAQEIGTAQILQAKVYVVTDGKKTFWINPATGQEILQEDGSRITLNFDKSSTECITLINKIRASINATNNQIKSAASVLILYRWPKRCGKIYGLFQERHLKIACILLLRFLSSNTLVI